MGTALKGLHPALYPIAYCQGGESLSAAAGHPVCLPACPVEGLRGLLSFAHFAGCEEAMLSSGDGRGSLWSLTLGQGGGREGKAARDTQ